MRTVKQARALATRDRFLAEAARLFALKGYDTKLEEIQNAAEVTTGAFFHHFAAKRISASRFGVSQRSRPSCW